MSTEQLFLLRRQDFEKEERLQKRSFDIISNLRLVVFVVGALAVLIAGYLGTARQALYVGLPFLLVFIYIIHRHDQVEARLNIARAMVKINQQYQDRLSGQWVKFTDQGQEFADPDHPYSTDLDIFGPKSLFQWLSVARTYCGRQHLYQLLAEPPKEPDSILARQGAIKELAGKLEFCQGLECGGRLAPEAGRNPEELIAYAEEISSVSQFMKIIRFLPPFTTLSLVLYFLHLLTLLIPIALLLLQGIIVLLTYKQAGAQLRPVYSFSKSLHSYAGMLESIEAEPFQNPYISSLQTELRKQTIPASAAMKDLGKISGAIDMNRSMFYLIINIGLLWDIQCAVRVAQWKSRYGDQVGCWLRVIGTMEALGSLAVITHIHPDWAYPEIEDQGQVISAGDLGHPLLPPDKCVRNDIDIDNYSCIVTGSNMSGKSTWLRAIGINLVLAYAGGAVCAAKFRCSVMDLYTSMEIRDDLLEGVSTFYAELKRINMILQHSRRGQPMIYLIDEIFRGTNSLDRITGAQVVLRKLSQNGAIGLLSTHDFELCELENEAWANFRNYHFQEHYTDGSIAFDYKLRSGRCSTSNARYLMKMVGIED